MTNFFSTLFKWNWANIGKAVIGGATGVLSYPAILAAAPIITPFGALAVAIIVGAGTALGVHGYHAAETVIPKTTLPPVMPN